MLLRGVLQRGAVCLQCELEQIGTIFEQIGTTFRQIGTTFEVHQLTKVDVKKKRYLYAVACSVL